MYLGFQRVVQSAEGLYCALEILMPFQSVVDVSNTRDSGSLSDASCYLILPEARLKTQGTVDYGI